MKTYIITYSSPNNNIHMVEQEARSTMEAIALYFENCPFMHRLNLIGVIEKEVK